MHGWDDDCTRFFAALETLDAYLASDAPLAAPAERLFQGAVADALTHTGQLAMLRRLGGGAIRPENYAKADIVAGTSDQNRQHRAPSSEPAPGS